MKRKLQTAIPGVLLFLSLTAPSWAGYEFKISDDTKMTFGIKTQVWTQYLGDAAASKKDPKVDFALRQFRFYGSGQAIPLLKFGFNVDAATGAWDGAEAKSSAASATDANLTFDFRPEVRLLLGLYRTPWSRFSLTDSYAGYLLPHAPEIAGGKYVGSLKNYRNAGVTLWGDALDGKVKYGAGIFDGDFSPGISTASGGAVPKKDTPFYSVRLAVSPLDPQKGYVFSQQWIGKAEKPVVTVGGAFLTSKYGITKTEPDTMTADLTTGVVTTTKGATTTVDEPTYRALSVDCYTEIPLGGGALGGEGAWFSYDRGIADGKASGWFLQSGYFIRSLNLQPAFRYEATDEKASGTGKDFTKLTAGLNYYLKGHDAKINLEYARKSFDEKGTTARKDKNYSDLTLQLQIQF